MKNYLTKTFRLVVQFFSVYKYYEKLTWCQARFNKKSILKQKLRQICYYVEVSEHIYFII